MIQAIWAMLRRVKIWTWIKMAFFIYSLLTLVVIIEQQSYRFHDLLAQEKNILASNHVVRPPFWISDIEKQREFIRLQITDPSDRQKYDEIQKKIDKDPGMKKIKWLKISSSFALTLTLFCALVILYLCFMPRSKVNKLIARLRTERSKEYYIYRWINKENIFIYRILGIMVVLSLFIDLNKPIWTWINLYYPHDKYDSEVDAAIITTFGSTFTLGLTLIITAYFNRQTQKAMLEQSRANLKEKVIETRLKFYPQLEQSLREIGDLFPEQVLDQKWTKAINKLEQLYNDKKYYMSKELRGKVKDLLHYIKTQTEELRLSQSELSALVELGSAPSHEDFSKWRTEKMKSIEESITKSDQTLDQLIKKCLEDIEKSMDLSSLVDLD